MRMADMFLKELEWEAPITRTMLERVPDDRWDWRPHEKSMKLGDLASHVATLPEWAVMAVKRTGLDLAPKDGPPYVVPVLKNAQECVAAYDQHLEQARAALSDVSDEELQGIWTLSAGGHVLFQLPRFATLRVMVFNHIVHHRAQLGVDLRLNGVPLPPSYGPSADELPSFAPPDAAPRG